jgi:ribonuclease P protein component
MRLRRSQDLWAVRRHGRRIQDERLILSTVPNRLDCSRFGFVVGRQVGRAVKRNLVRRRLRAAAHQWLPRMRSGYDIVIAARPAAAEAPYDALKRGMGELLEQARLLVEPETGIE